MHPSAGALRNCQAYNGVNSAALCRFSTIIHLSGTGHDGRNSAVDFAAARRDVVCM